MDALNSFILSVVAGVVSGFIVAGISKWLDGKKKK